MRLSTAIMLGAATCKMEAGNINSCAYGAALNAMGIPLEVDGMQDGGPRYFAIEGLWPWTVDGELWHREAAKVITLFDSRVCDGRMTLEQLVDWVRSVEPDCDCNRFNCTCTKEDAAIIHSKEEQHAGMGSTPDSSQ